MEFKLEICVDTIESAMLAQYAGADRIELCNSLHEGGTTPGFGMISSARNNLCIGVNVLIRPRGGDFLYSEIEYDIMRRDINVCGECGVDGVVLGILLPGGEIDIERTAKLVELSRPMSVTFHRAFDMCNNPIKGLEDIIVTGADRILTSGQKNKAEDGTGLIFDLIAKSDGRIIIMPGSGLSSANILTIARETGAKEFHLTGRKSTESGMIFRQQGISMGGTSNIPEFSRKVADPEVIRSIINNLKMM